MNSQNTVSLKELELESRRVLVRANLDVPIRDGVVTDQSRIRVLLPTLNHLIDNGARIILLGQRGDPGGIYVPNLTLEPIGACLAAMPQIGEIFLTDSPVGDAARSVIHGLREGQVCLLENIAFHAGEQRNDDRLARQLASFCDIYVNEALSLSEYQLASTCRIHHHARLRAPGLQFAAEIEALSRLLSARDKSLVLLLGGHSLESQLPLLEHLFDRLDTLLIAGSIALTFVAARHGKTGQNAIEQNRLPIARDILERAARKNVKIQLPLDVVITENDADRTVVPTNAIPDTAHAIDIGPASVAAYKRILSKAGAVLWTGSIFMNEQNRVMEGTVAVAKALAGSAAFSVILDNDIASVIRSTGLEKGVDMICTGESAALRLLEGKPLPALQALGIGPGKQR